MGARLFDNAGLVDPCTRAEVCIVRKLIKRSAANYSNYEVGGYCYLAQGSKAGRKANVRVTSNLLVCCPGHLREGPPIT